jgi:hypothetical protein
MAEALQIIVLITTALMGMWTVLLTFSTPIRNRFLGIREAKYESKRELEERRETDMCLLRDRILSCYFKRYQSREIKQFEFENVGLMYRQYKKLGGNSFVDKIWQDMQGWTILR